MSASTTGAYFAAMPTTLRTSANFATLVQVSSALTVMALNPAVVIATRRVPSPGLNQFTIIAQSRLVRNIPTPTRCRQFGLCPIAIDRCLPLCALAACLMASSPCHLGSEMGRPLFV